MYILLDATYDEVVGQNSCMHAGRVFRACIYGPEPPLEPFACMHKCPPGHAGDMVVRNRWLLQRTFS